MTLILDGTNGLSDVDGSAATPALRGSDANTGIFFPAADTIAFSEGGAEAMRIDSDGDVGIGTTTPAKKLDILSNTSQDGIRISGSANPRLTIIDTTTPVQFDALCTDTEAVLRTDTNHPLVFSTNGTERMRIDSAGAVLAGTASSVGSSPMRFQAKGGAGGTLPVAGYSIISGNDEVAGQFFITASSENSVQIAADPQNLRASSSLQFATDGSERARIDSSGNLLVGTTSYAGVGISIATADNNGCYSDSANTATRNHWRFSNPNGVVGSIQTSASLTLYNTTSDYRLKNITGPITNSGSYIDSLNPVEGTWKADGSTFVGLIAHEAQEASRTQVATGIKDGAEMQAMDYSNSELIANLIAEIQSLRKRLADAGI